MSRALRPPRPILREVLAVERDASINSTWFVFVRTAQNSRAPLSMLFNPDYSLDSIRPLLGELVAAGAEIGLHGSPQAASRPSLLREEFELLNHAASYRVRGLRQHAAATAWPITVDSARACGLTYDSSDFRNDQNGYLAGVSFPSRLRGIWMVPVTWMDTAELNYASKNSFTTLSSLDQAIHNARETQSLCSVNTHCLEFDKEDLHQYEGILGRALDQGAWIGPLKDLLAHTEQVSKVCPIEVDAVWYAADRVASAD